MSTPSGGQTTKSSLSGYSYGLNAGAFTRIGAGGTSVGGLISFVARKPTRACTTYPGYAEQCSDLTDMTAAKVLGFTVALLM